MPDVDAAHHDPALPGRPSADDVVALLRGVIDPELGSDVVDLGMIRHAGIDDDEQ